MWVRRFFCKRSSRKIILPVLFTFISILAVISCNPFESHLIYRVQKGIRIDFEEKFSEKFKLHARKAYWYHRNKCKNYLDINKSYNDCLGKYGFMAGTLESLEVLYLLDMTREFNDAIKIMNRNFKCNANIWVDRHDMWTRGVASLIGAHLLTKKKIFLEKAEECACSLLNSDQYAMKINLKTRNWHNSKIINGTFAYQLVSGLPELTALYSITKKEKYFDGIKRIIASLPNQAGHVSSLYNIETKAPIESGNNINSNTEIFYRTIAIAKHLNPQLNFDPRVYFDEDSANASFIASIILGYKDEERYKNGLKERENFETIINNLNGFKFEDPFLDIMRLNKDFKYTVKYTLQMLKACETKDGFSNIKFTSAGRTIQTNNQSPSILGNWIKQGLLSISKSGQYRRAILNEHGHFLQI